MLYAAFTAFALVYTLTAISQLTRFGLTPRRSILAALSAAGLLVGSCLYVRRGVGGSGDAARLGVIFFGVANGSLLLWSVWKDRALWARHRDIRRRAHNA